MRYWQTPACLGFLALLLGLSAPLRAEDFLQISEFLALNEHGLDDEDRDEEDWIEVHNIGSSRASLEGWYLTDSPSRLTKWRFPAVTLEPDGYLVVFASGKDRRDPAGTLHTNFRLSGSGEYLGLVRPDGVTIASEYSPAYPVQAPDVSYGLGETSKEEILLAVGAPARALVPLDGSLDPPAGSTLLRPWTLEDFDDSAWPSGTTGVGFGRPGWIGLDVAAARTRNQTVYVRVPFVVQDPSIIMRLTLRIWFDDGFIAYLNGHEVARDNAPELGAETWNSGAPETWPAGRGVVSKDFALRGLDFLHVGTNVLAVQGLNNDVNSPDLLVAPELIAAIAAESPPHRYFPTPTPGGPNGAGVEVLGPIITDVNHTPALPIQGRVLAVTARVAPSFAPVASVELHYRVMFGAEQTIPMRDDGAGDDEAAGDGVYAARIPSGVLNAGQMVRWYLTATDTAGRPSRFPAYLDPTDSPQYDGTVVADPSLTNPLPVLHWFIESPSAAGSDAGTRCSFFFHGEFYDNVWINIHGQSSRSFPKKSHNVSFNPGHHFRWAVGQPRAGALNLMSTYADKAQMRNILAYETYRDAGCAYHWVFPVRVHQNGTFWGTAHVMENGDKDWLLRMGLNAGGALYKMYNSFTSTSDCTSGAEKKTRKNEDNSDLRALFEGISLSGAAQRQYLYDNVDVAEVVDFLAARIVTGDIDCCHKNYYLYRDTGRSNEWQMWPWDVDLSFGRVWSSGLTYWDQILHANTALFVGGNNRLPQAVFNSPDTRQMYLRRVRTLMDELLQSGPLAVKPTPSPSPTPSPRPRVIESEAPRVWAAADAEAQYYEPRIDELAAQIAPDAVLDNAKWNSNAWGNGSTAPNYPQPYLDAVAELRDSYLPQRRQQMFNRLAPGTSELPEAQSADTVVLFGTIETNPLSRNQDQQYLQLLNPNNYAVDISNWTLQAGAEASSLAPIFIFRGGTVIPAGGALYVAASRPAFRARAQAPKGGQALFVVGDYTGRLPAQGVILQLTNRLGAVVDTTAH
jgi:hypothetical protein